jgi:oxalate decarboxylase/phosphoglucose isomerase-like protein (cupin superfamily)
VTDAPLVINLFHNLDFIFNCDYAFRDRFNEEADYFSAPGKALSKLFWETNFVRDVKSFELVERKWRVAGERMRHLEIANNVMSAHISEFPVGTYKKAHRHGPGAHVIVLKGEGYSLLWPEGAEIQRYDWQEGSLFVPPERWFHQHFNKGTVPARYLALKPFTSRKYPGLKKRFGITEATKGNNDQIEFENEDPRIREIFEEELAAKGLRIGTV